MQLCYSTLITIAVDIHYSLGDKGKEGVRISRSVFVKRKLMSIDSHGTKPRLFEKNKAVESV